jgi:MFS family permease
MLGLGQLQGKALYKAMSAASGAAFMLYGYDAGVLGGFQETKQFRAAIGNPQGSFTIPLIASSYNLAAGVMSLCTSFFSMQLSRKRTILLGNLFICIGAVLQASAFSVPHILVGRIATGAGIGCIASTVPTYMAEMSLEANERGPEVSYQLALLISAVALAYWLDLGFVQGLKAHPWLWRVPLAMQSCFAIFSTCLLAFLPDTPRWYYARGRYDEADRCLARLYSLPVESEVVQQTREEVLNSLKDEENDSASFNWWLLFWDNSELQFGRRLRTSFLILWAQQFRKFTPQNPHVVCFDRSLTHRSKSRHQHAGLLLHPDLLQPRLLPHALRHPRRRHEHHLRHRLIPIDLVHREARSPRNDVLVCSRLWCLHAHLCRPHHCCQPHHCHKLGRRRLHHPLQRRLRIRLARHLLDLR